MLIASLAAAILMGRYQASDYRSRFPMPDLSVPSGWGVNVNAREMDDQNIDEIAKSGAKWVRMDLTWSRVEKEAGKYDFSKYDPVIDGFSRHGIRAILTLDYGNKAYDVDAPRTREGRAAFAAFAAESVKHFRHDGILWEIWNEPNLSHFWRGEPSADEYAALVRVVVPAMREVSSDEWIIGPAISRFDMNYLDGCFAKGILQDIDAVSVHAYRDNNPPETVKADWTQLRNLVAKYAPSGKTISLISGEWGYSTYSKGVSERTQGQFAARQYLANLEAGVPITIWYSWKDRPEGSTEKEQHFGLLDSQLSNKGGRDAIQTLLGSLNGYTLESRVDFGDDQDSGLIFKKGTTRKLVAWTSANTTQSVRLPASAAWFATSTTRQINLTQDVQVFAQH
jgi:hypothetical protein